MCVCFSHNFSCVMAEKRRVGFDPAFAKLLADHSARVIAGQKVWRTQIQPGELQKAALRVATIGQPGGYGPFGNYGGNADFADARTRINPRTGSAFTLERVPRRLDPDPAQGAPHTHHGSESESELTGGALHGGELGTDQLRNILKELVAKMRAEEAQAAPNAALLARYDRAIHVLQMRLFVALRAERGIATQPHQIPDMFDAGDPLAAPAQEAAVEDEPEEPAENPHVQGAPPGHGGPPGEGAGMHGGDFWSTLGDIRTGLSRGVKLINPYLQPALDIAGMAPIPGAAIAAKAVGTAANFMGGSAKSGFVRKMAGQRKIDLDKLPTRWWGKPPEPGKPNKWDKYLAQTVPSKFGALRRAKIPEFDHVPVLRRSTRERRAPKQYGAGLHGDSDSDSDSNSSDSDDDEAMLGGSAKSGFIRMLAGKRKIDLDKLPTRWWGKPPEPGKPNKWDKYLRRRVHFAKSQTAVPAKFGALRHVKIPEFDDVPVQVAPPYLQMWHATPEGRKRHRDFARAHAKKYAEQMITMKPRGAGLHGGSGDIRGYPAEAQLARAQAYARAMAGRQRPNQGYDGPARSGFDELATGEQDAQLLRDISDLVVQASQDGASVSTRQALSEAILSNASRLSDASLEQVANQAARANLPQSMLLAIERLARNANVSASERVMLLRHALKVFREALAETGDVDEAADRLRQDPAIARLFPAPGENAPLDQLEFPDQLPSRTPDAGYVEPDYVQLQQQRRNPVAVDVPPPDYGDEDDFEDGIGEINEARARRFRQGFWDDDDEDEGEVLPSDLQEIDRMFTQLVYNSPLDERVAVIQDLLEHVETGGDDAVTKNHVTNTLLRLLAEAHAGEGPEPPGEGPEPDAPPGEGLEPPGEVPEPDAPPGEGLEPPGEGPEPDAPPGEGAAAADAVPNVEGELLNPPPPLPHPDAAGAAGELVGSQPGDVDQGNPVDANAAPPVQDVIAERAEAEERREGGPEAVVNADRVAEVIGVNPTDAGLQTPAQQAAVNRLLGTTAPRSNLHTAYASLADDDDDDEEEDNGIRVTPRVIRGELANVDLDPRQPRRGIYQHPPGRQQNPRAAMVDSAADEGASDPDITLRHDTPEEREAAIETASELVRTPAGKGALVDYVKSPDGRSSTLKLIRKCQEDLRSGVIPAESAEFTRAVLFELMNALGLAEGIPDGSAQLATRNRDPYGYRSATAAEIKRLDFNSPQFRRTSAAAPPFEVKRPTLDATARGRRPNASSTHA